VFQVIWFNDEREEKWKTESMDNPLTVIGDLIAYCISKKKILPFLPGILNIYYPHCNAKEVKKLLIGHFYLNG
jgi:hypothetical protein